MLKNAIGCPHCGNTIPAGAAQCPRCAMNATEAATLQAAYTRTARSPKHMGLLSFAVIGLIAFWLFSGRTPGEPPVPANAAETHRDSARPPETSPPAAQIAPAERATPTVLQPDVPYGSGTWGDYSYKWTRGKDRDAIENTVVTFFPVMLPRNDTVVIAAMRHMARELLAVDIDRVPPKPMGKSIYFWGAPTLSFLLVKEDSGEIHSLVIRKER